MGYRNWGVITPNDLNHWFNVTWFPLCLQTFYRMFDAPLFGVADVHGCGWSKYQVKRQTWPSMSSQNKQTSMLKTSSWTETGMIPAKLFPRPAWCLRSKDKAGQTNGASCLIWSAPIVSCFHWIQSFLHIHFIDKVTMDIGQTEITALKTVS